MTHAVCVMCGAMKFGALTPCTACGEPPRGRRLVAYSMFFSDHHIPEEELRELSRRCLAGEGLPALPEADEARLVEAYGRGLSEP